ncbi:MAG: hypothetical protein IMZ50_01255 [Candidatus Atribacteria bacterium]|nr:hypothetical protein [Candidatus Atribacteria bacterium]
MDEGLGGRLLTRERDGVAVNPALGASPELVNKNPFNEGWLLATR